MEIHLVLPYSYVFNDVYASIFHLLTTIIASAGAAIIAYINAANNNALIFVLMEIHLPLCLLIFIDQFPFLNDYLLHSKFNYFSIMLNS
jgi:hypothetical protein